jgi:hypothetical protein
MREHLHVHYRRQPIFIANQIFELPTQPSSILLEIANAHTISLVIKQDDDDSNRELSKDECEHPGESTLSSDIEEDDLDNQQEVPKLDQEHRDKSIRTPKVPQPKKRSCADTVIARTLLPNLRHPAGAIAPLLLKHQKSAIIILCKSDDIPAQALALPKAGGDQYVPQPKAVGYHTIPRYQNATCEVAKRFMEAIVFPTTSWPNISDEKYSMVDEPWKLTIEAQDRQRALAGAPVGTPSVCQMPSGPSLKIDPQTREAVTVYSGF